MQAWKTKCMRCDIFRRENGTLKGNEIDTGGLSERQRMA